MARTRHALWICVRSSDADPCAAHAYPCALHSGRSLERTASVADPFGGVNPQLSGTAAVEEYPPYRQGLQVRFFRRLVTRGCLSVRGKRFANLSEPISGVKPRILVPIWAV